MLVLRLTLLLFLFPPIDVLAAPAIATESSDAKSSNLADGDSLAATNNRQETYLQEVVNRMRRHRNVAQSQRLSPPLLVCVQKYDVWKSLVPHAIDPATGAERIDPSSIMFSQSQGIAGLDVEELNLISLLLRGFLNELSPEFVAQAESNFEVVRYLAVSALGTSPEYADGNSSTLSPSDMLKVRPSDLRPFRVTDPVLWLLQHGI